MIDVSLEARSVSRSVNATCRRDQAAFTTVTFDDTRSLPLDCIVSAFWPQIRALLFAGLGPSDIADILGCALLEMGYAEALSSIDFTCQIVQRTEAERTSSSKGGDASGSTSEDDDVAIGG